MKRLLVVAAIAAAPLVPASSASASPCLPILCQPGPVTRCFDTGDVRFCI